MAARWSKPELGGGFLETDVGFSGELRVAYELLLAVASEN